jgi:flagellar motor switch protein FliN/FliY
MADNPQLSAIAKWSVDEFAKGFGLAIEGMAGTPPGVSFEMLDAAPGPAVPLLGWSQPFNGLPGEALVMTPEPDVLALGQHVMQAAGVDDCSQEDLKSTFLECVGQAFSLLARAMTARLQREVTPAAGSEAQAAAANLTWGSVRLTLEERTASVFLGLPANLLEAFLAEPQTAPQTAPQEVAQAAAAGASSSPNPAPTQIAPTTRAPAEHSKTFDLLLDVELPVSVSFGHAQVPLKDVLKLTTGSIVELSRAVVEPVDIVVNNCVIARGEVVVVEGNFGVRIQQVISRSERLRSLQ